MLLRDRITNGFFLIDLRTTERGAAFLKLIDPTPPLCARDIQGNGA